MIKWKLVQRTCRVCKRTWRALSCSKNEHCSFRCKNPRQTSYVDFNNDDGPAPMDTTYTASKKRRREKIRDWSTYKTVINPKYLLTP